MRYTTVTMIDDRRGFAWSEPLQKRLESYTFSWRNVGNHWGCFTSHGLWDQPPGTMAWCNGSDTRSIEYWVALREVWFDFLAYRVNDFWLWVWSGYACRSPDSRLCSQIVEMCCWEYDVIGFQFGCSHGMNKDECLACGDKKQAGSVVWADFGSMELGKVPLRFLWFVPSALCCHGLQLIRHVAFPPQI